MEHHILRPSIMLDQNDDRMLSFEFAQITRELWDIVTSLHHRKEDWDETTKLNIMVLGRLVCLSEIDAGLGSLHCALTHRSAVYRAYYDNLVALVAKYPCLDCSKYIARANVFAMLV